MWTQKTFNISINRLYAEGVSLDGSNIRDEFPALYNAARILYGSWQKALKKNKIKIDIIDNWSRGRIISEIERMNKAGEDISSCAISKDLYGAARQKFGSWKQALEVAGISLNISVENLDEEKVKKIIHFINEYGELLNYKYIYYKYPKLLKFAEKYFGSWKNAIESCGIDYKDIKKNRSTEFIGKDGRNYESSLKMLTSNELFELKSLKKINNYETNININKWIECDFLIYLNNNTELYVEIDPNIKTYKEKVKYFQDAGLIFESITSTNQLPIIIFDRTKTYKIPEKPAVITAHANPDADAISSCVAVYSYLENLGIKSWIRLEGEISDNLKVLIPEESLKPIENTEQVIVLDSGYEYERLGWQIPELPIFNIDHHTSRISFHNPNNNIFIFNSCSTAAILIRHFGLNDKRLLAGIYGDTLFRRRMLEVSRLLITLNIDDNIAQEIINIVDLVNSGMILSAIQKAHIIKHRNGFMLVELTDTISSWALTDIMSIMSRMSESICLISENGEVRLRTSNKDLDVSQIASQFGGGGHSFAAGCFINKRSKLKRMIRSMKGKK